MNVPHPIPAEIQGDDDKWWVNERVVYRATQGTVGASGVLVDYVKCRDRVECQVKFGCHL